MLKSYIDLYIYMHNCHLPRIIIVLAIYFELNLPQTLLYSSEPTDASKSLYQMMIHHATGHSSAVSLLTK